VFVSLYSWYFLSVRGVLSSSRFATVRFFWDCSGCGSICFVVGGSYGGSSIHGYRGVRSISTPTPSSYPS
jgi:23S rRNA pseudoU1915 N3-methylase RlmH